MEERSGYDRLWKWFGLSYASWLTIPRVLLHEMPDEWQFKLAELLEEYSEAHNFEKVDVTAIVSLKDNQTTEFVKTPEWITNYRHPDREFINSIKADLK